PIFVYHSAEVFFCTGEYDKSIEQCRKAVEIESTFFMAHTLIGWNFVFLERPEEAFSAFAKAKELEPQVRLSLTAWSRRMSQPAGRKRLGKSQDKSSVWRLTLRRCGISFLEKPIGCLNGSIKLRMNAMRLCSGSQTYSPSVNSSTTRAISRSCTR